MLVNSVLLIFLAPKKYSSNLLKCGGATSAMCYHLG